MTTTEVYIFFIYITAYMVLKEFEDKKKQLILVQYWYVIT